MSGDAQLMLIIAGMHVLGIACAVALIVPALRNRPDAPPNGSDDGWGGGPSRPIEPPAPPRGGIPLPDAQPARVRLRDHRRLADRLPRHDRRPAREPERRPVRS